MLLYQSIKVKEKDGMHKCSGLMRNNISCNRMISTKDKFCSIHSYFKDFKAIDYSELNYCSKCEVYFEGDDRHCRNGFKINTKSVCEDDGVKCIGITSAGNRCFRKKVNGTRFCKTHSYLDNYDDDILKSLVLCSDCRKWKEQIMNYTSCKSCRAKAEITNKKRSLRNKEKKSK